MKIKHSDYLSASEQAALHTNLQTAPAEHKLLIESALATGARASELLAVSRVDLNDAQQTVLIKGLKGSNDREIPVKPELYAQLVAAAESNGGKCFKIAYRTFYKYWCQVRPVKKKLHSTRHTFAINLYIRTKDIRLVQVALGHKSLLNTMAYANLIIETNQLREALL